MAKTHVGPAVGQAPTDAALAEVCRKVDSTGSILTQQKDDFLAMMASQQSQQMDMATRQQELNTRIPEQQLQFQQATNDRFDQLSQQITSRGAEGSSPQTATSCDVTKLTKCVADLVAGLTSMKSKDDVDIIILKNKKSTSEGTTSATKLREGT